MYDRLYAKLKQQSVFLAYSLADQTFVDAFAAALRARGIRCTKAARWCHDGRRSDSLEKTISLHQAVLLVASEAALQSDWVQAEIREARRRDEGQPSRLWPIDIDDVWQRFADRHGGLDQEPTTIARHSSSEQFELGVDELVKRLRTSMAGVVPRRGNELPAHRVFISHCLRDAQRTLVDAFWDRAGHQGISRWEYENDNTVGEDWEKELQIELSESTHAIILLTDDYDDRPNCKAEIATLVERYKNEGTPRLLAYRIFGRSEPHPALVPFKIHQGKIDVLEPVAHAVELILQDLLRWLRLPGNKRRH
jgi:hypothetical protein